MKRGSSLRLTEWPMPPTSGVVRGAIVPPSTQPGGRVLNRLDDVHIARAAAKIAGNRVADLRFGRVRVTAQEGDASHHHARRAVSALEPVLLPETLLNRMELPILFEPFDRHDLGAVCLDGKHGARLHGFFVENHRTGAAVRRVAADVRARQPELVAQEMNEEQPRIDLPL